MKKQLRILFLTILAALLLPESSKADIRLPVLISDGMVLQRDIDLRGEWLFKVGQVFKPVSYEPAAGSQSFSMQNEPTGLFNTMVAPVIDYRIKGILWYQGETNANKPQEYQKLLPAIPFLFVQLPNFMEAQYLPSESQWAELRFGQLKSLSVQNTAMAVTIDAGEWNDIHPLEKKVVGERLALAARKLAYGDEKTVYSGPIFKSISKEGDRIIIKFSHIGSGLIVKGGGELNYFSVAGENRKFVWAEARIIDNHVIFFLRRIRLILFNKGQPRKPDDWGSLKAWAWGAARGLDCRKVNQNQNTNPVSHPQMI